ncbi:MuF-like minor capsid protein [Mycobacterium phage Kahlid]|uniref:MuF-like minor capsid protein n=1 Tax=Mycobacterium phage Finemlucis TaxID=2015844 RepID=A0A291I9P3_9CAUD|nr:head maturation protease [Mycobacterium phage Gardann]YP_010012844.1 head maturation protease [Mycobacterium phage Finemlucis]ALY07326.1 MuF-like minor capsid protein [Mycobacterium phage MkaliMitinis3]AOT22997.1 MuF-like minor capsid protein [Mycobacterium phage Wilder]ASR87390.1 MuF-like minor capsid protein [Mycobacterium phage Nicholasp3]QDK03804.1 MuF-like minor capsid protein [Mycobacterium phage Lewan]QGJ96317.1 MuF-like minor capsid protein [Mycobacterium phage Kahlid]UJQ87016.1 h
MAEDDQDEREDKATLPLIAVPALAAWYATQHVERQEQIAATTTAGLALLWPIINFGDLDGSTPAWLHATTLQIKTGWDESANAAFEYVQQALFANEPDATPPVKAAVKFPAQEIQTAMRVRGPVEVKRQVARAKPESEAMEAGKSASQAVGATKATDGGRSEVLQFVQREAPRRLKQGKAIGYARKTDNNPCYFCAILASQGAVYYKETAFADSSSKLREVKWSSNRDKGARRAFIGDGPAKVHDNCQCTMRPVFSEKDKWDERAKFFLDQWIAHGHAGVGPDGKYRSAEQNFRRNYVSPPPYSADVLDLSERRKIIADVQENRERLLARGFKADSPNVKFIDDSIKRLSIA